MTELIPNERERRASLMRQLRGKNPMNSLGSEGPDSTPDTDGDMVCPDCLYIEGGAS